MTPYHLLKKFSEFIHHFAFDTDELRFHRITTAAHLAFSAPSSSDITQAFKRFSTPRLLSFSHRNLVFEAALEAISFSLVTNTEALAQPLCTSISNLRQPEPFFLASMCILSSWSTLLNFAQRRYRLVDRELELNFPVLKEAHIAEDRMLLLAPSLRVIFNTSITPVPLVIRQVAHLLYSHAYLPSTSPMNLHRAPWALAQALSEATPEFFCALEQQVSMILNSSPAPTLDILDQARSLRQARDLSAHIPQLLARSTRHHTL